MVPGLRAAAFKGVCVARVSAPTTAQPFLFIKGFIHNYRQGTTLYPIIAVRHTNEEPFLHQSQAFAALPLVWMKMAARAPSGLWRLKAVTRGASNSGQSLQEPECFGSEQL